MLNPAKFYEPLLGPILKPLRQDLLKLACIARDDVFLDCCCGAGGLLKFCFNGGQKNIIGLDISHHMLAEAQKNAPTAHIICGDIANIPFADKSIDIASVCMALHAMPIDIAKQGVLELCRVAKRVFIADYCLTERNLYFPATAFAHTVEFLVGGEHYKCYKNFMQLGGIEGFLHSMNIAVNERYMTLGGSVLIVDVKG